MVGGKRRSKAYECLWNIKYLSGFKWVHLTEQLDYEKASTKQKLRAEISQAKRQANFFAEQVDKGENLKKLEEKVLKKGGLWQAYERQIKQKSTVTENISKKNKKTDDEALFGMIFNTNTRKTICAIHLCEGVLLSSRSKKARHVDAVSRCVENAPVGKNPVSRLIVMGIFAVLIIAVTNFLYLKDLNERFYYLSKRTQNYN
uniref:Uncharacterized protein n=1 Tax=Romanomermis culicivorax TaxID=13658 RepID=A0A915J4H4_ROMCU